MSHPMLLASLHGESCLVTPSYCVPLAG